MSAKRVWLLRRYTGLTAAIHILSTRKITLLDPGTWDDRNDAYFLTQYGVRRGGKRVLALCFCQGQQQYHHWRVYANGMDGVCVEFDRDLLLGALDQLEDIQHGPVVYRPFSEVVTDRLGVDELPFLKRIGYKDEKEYRVIHVPADQFRETRDCEIPLKCVRRVICSPWMPNEVMSSLTNALQSIPDCRGLPVRKSTLVNSEAWKNIARRAGRTEDKLLADRPSWIPSEQP